MARPGSRPQGQTRVAGWRRSPSCAGPARVASPCGSHGRQLHAPQPGLLFANICSAIAGAFPAPRGVTGLGKVCRVSKRRCRGFGDSGRAGSVPRDLPLVFHLSPDSQIAPEPHKLLPEGWSSRGRRGGGRSPGGLGRAEAGRAPGRAPTSITCLHPEVPGPFGFPSAPCWVIFSPRIPSQRRILQLVALNSITGASIGAVPLAGVAHTTAASPEPADLRRIWPRRRQIAKITF